MAYDTLSATAVCTVLNVTEVASNVQLLRWPLRQGYLETPLCVWCGCLVCVHMVFCVQDNTG